MPLPPAWSAWQLAEFLEVVSSFETEDSAALGAVERAAEALDAEVAVILSAGRVVASVGYPASQIPLAELRAAAYGDSRKLLVPGVGWCPAVRVPLDHPEDARLVLARSGPNGLGRDEVSVLRAMARVTAMTMRILRLLDDERAARRELQLLADEQAALRRVAVLVAQDLPQGDVFSVVAQEVGRLADAGAVQVIRYFDDGAAIRLALWDDRAGVAHDATIGDEVSSAVFRTGQPVRKDMPAGPHSETAPVCSTVGIPIMAEGGLWGAVIVTTTRPQSMPKDTEQRISAFTELVATAIANAQARAELAASRARAVAAADETRRRIGRDLHDGVQQHLASLALTIRLAQAVVPPGSEELVRRLSQVAAELQQVFHDLQVMARGLHPTVLSKGGLGPALRMVTNRSAIPVELELGLDARLPDAVEIAAYYIVSEGLANAIKHAHASAVHVGVRMSDGRLRVDVRDNGTGGADAALGSGLIGLRDRVAALGGTITVLSPPGDGTVIMAEIPAESRAAQRDA